MDQILLLKRYLVSTHPTHPHIRARLCAQTHGPMCIEILYLWQCLTVPGTQISDLETHYFPFNK